MATVGQLMFPAAFNLRGTVVPPGQIETSAVVQFDVEPDLVAVVAGFGANGRRVQRPVNRTAAICSKTGKYDRSSPTFY